jgi:hypothetical protein
MGGWCTWNCSRVVYTFVMCVEGVEIHVSVHAYVMCVEGVDIHVSVHASVMGEEGVEIHTAQLQACGEVL